MLNYKQSVTEGLGRLSYCHQECYSKHKLESRAWRRICRTLEMARLKDMPSMHSGWRGVVVNGQSLPVLS